MFAELLQSDWFYDIIEKRKKVSILSDNKEKQYVSDNAQLMKEWYKEKNELLGILSSKTTLHSNKKVWWKCEKEHFWKMSPDKKLKSKGCPFCLNKRVLVGYNDLATLFPHLSKEWDVTENEIDINSVVIGSAQKIHWICSKCQHKWVAAVRMRTQRGHGCPECAKKIRANNRTETLVEKNGCITDPHLLKEWNYEKNEELGLFPDKFTPYSNKKVWWRCSTCGYEWKATVSNRSRRGDSCPLCANRVVVPGINDLCTTHPELADEWDFEENEDLLPQNVSYGMGKKVSWKCPLGHKYKATILHRSSGTNCPICNSGRQTSFAEQAIFYYLKKLYPNAINRYRDIFDNGMELDVYIPEIRYGIEYDGSFWHQGNKYEREKRKFEICKANGIKLIRIKSFENDHSLKLHYADWTFFLKEDNLLELEKLIQMLCSRLYNSNMHPIKKWENFVSMVNIERDKYKIFTYRYNLKDSFADQYPEIAKEWHPTKNGNILPNMFKSGSSFLAWWLCPTCGREWKANIHARAKGGGCKNCQRVNNSGGNHYKAKKIYQYAKEGQFIKEWEAISDASKTLRINQSNISMCAEGKRAVAGGYRWSFKLSEKLPPIQKKHRTRKGINGKSVNQIDLQGTVVNHFATLNEAQEKTGINSTSISKVINGHIKTAGGFFWTIDNPEKKQFPQ